MNLEKEVLVLPEKTKILWRDPDELLKDNPAALIINRDAYDGMKVHFSEARFLSSLPHIARVEIYAPGDKIEAELIIDGLTRTKFASDHKGKVLKEAPNMKFDQIRIIDITDDLLKDERIVPEPERRENQTALTLVQYLRAVIPWTVAHQDIAPERIASYLINSWKGMVGYDLAEKFPALAALSFFANDRVNNHTEREFEKSLQRQERFVANEQKEERERLKRALCDIAEIIRKSNLRETDVEQSAYSLIGSRSAVIGGAKETQEQIFGLLRSEAFGNKLNREYPDRLAEAEKIRLEFARALEEAFVRLSPDIPGNDTARSEVRRALNDLSLSIDQTLQIITAYSPIKRYNEIMIDLNRQTLKRHYCTLVKRWSLMQTEDVLINNLGGHTHLNEFKLPEMADSIRTTASFLLQSQQWQEQLSTRSEDLTNRGVNKDTIERAVASMSQRQEAVLAADSLGILSERLKKLQETFAQFQREIGSEILQFEVGQVVSKLMEQELKTSGDPKLYKEIVWAVVHDKNIDATDKVAVTRWIQGFKSLDPHIQDEVLLGSMPLIAALKVHRGPKSIVVPPLTIKPPELVPVSSLVAPVIEGQLPVSAEEIDRRRIERNIERLQREVIEAHLEPASRILATLDLAAEEVPLPLKKILGDAETAIEKLRGGHPNVVRVMDKTYRELLEENARLKVVIANTQRHQEDRATYSDRDS